MWWQTFCEINRFKLAESKNKVIYIDSVLTKRSGHQFKHCLSFFKFAKELQFDEVT